MPEMNQEVVWNQWTMAEKPFYDATMIRPTLPSALLACLWPQIQTVRSMNNTRASAHDSSPTYCNQIKIRSCLNLSLSPALPSLPLPSHRARTHSSSTHPEPESGFPVSQVARRAGRNSERERDGQGARPWLSLCGFLGSEDAGMRKPGRAGGEGDRVFFLSLCAK
jgi:hypothetical protein